jgi:serine/threonine-protein kinase
MGATQSPPREPQVGYVLDGRYTLLERLGAGGMGVVYRAEHRYTGDLVAVKVLPGGSERGGGSGEIRRRFLKEPHLQSLARHPNVLRVIDAGVAGVQAYLVTEYVDGEDLQRRLDERGALPVGETLAILRQAAAALDAAHERGIVHRDVKPANVLIRADGHVLLTDFGVARDAAGAEGTAMFVGTTSYAAPEQITLEGGVDARADVYALACLMFHCLSGRPPFEGTSAYELMTKHVVEPPPAVSKAGSDLPAALDPVLMRALAKNRGDRPPGCLDLIAEAAAATGTELACVTVPPPRPPTARPAGPRVQTHTYPYATEPGGPTTETIPTVKRRSVARALALIVVAALLAGAVAAYVIGRGHGSASSARQATTGTRQPAAPGFTGDAAKLAAYFPRQISKQRCSVAPDGANPAALVQLRCSADGGRIVTFYALWPSQDAMKQLLDDNGSGLNVYFAGTWSDAQGTTQGRIDRFVTGLLDPQNVILWSYRSANATIWAQSRLSQDEMLAWWRAHAPRAPAQSRI